ncbi:MAG: hypothetical protein IKS49_04045 [Actinomycetaceae bacterium]|nr:hypothetical protein [Actinomycetaceae bacterium]
MIKENYAFIILDAAYLALREYLNAVQLNIDGPFEGFSREVYAALLRDYDVALNNVMQVLTDVAKKAADDAQTTANQALSDAQAAVGELTLWGADGAISPMEKRGLVQIKANIQEERDTLVAKATLYVRDYTDFAQATTRALTALNKYTADLTTTQARDADYEYIAAWYGYRDTLAESIDAYEKSLIDAKAASSDVAYLTQALAKDDTVIAGGMVLSSFIGVKENNSVKAAINASGDIAGFRETTHGILMIAAGITNLATAATTAKTRIFEDGTIVTNSLYALNGGIIGGFVIGTTSLYNGMASFASADDGVYLGTDGIGLGGGKFRVSAAGALYSVSGLIGSFHIGQTSLYNGMESLADTTHDGVYIGTDGIALGKGAFKVTKAGVLTANNATISGAITTSNLTATGGTIGGFTIATDHLGIAGSQPTPSGSPSSNDNGMALYANYLQFKRSNSNVKARLTIGGSVYGDSYVGGKAVEAWLDGLGNTQSLPIYGIGMSLNVTRFQKNIAIDCVSGMISGLRPLVYYSTGGFIYTDRIASDYPTRAHTIIVNNTGQNGTLYVSSSPQDGEEYLFVHMTTNAFYISPRDSVHPIWVQHENQWHVGMNVTSISSTAREMCLLIYNASMTATINGTTYTGCWICQFFHN